jgi:hypothetical protein
LLFESICDCACVILSELSDLLDRFGGRFSRGSDFLGGFLEQLACGFLFRELLLSLLDGRSNSLLRGSRCLLAGISRLARCFRSQSLGFASGSLLRCLRGRFGGVSPGICSYASGFCCSVGGLLLCFFRNGSLSGMGFRRERRLLSCIS